MICMIRILAGVAPCDMHLARCQVNDHRTDRTFAVERVDPLNIMVADRIRQVNVILLDALQ